jgi:predicted TIM-barrel fold metal-dependent hydrolase
MTSAALESIPNLRFGFLEAGCGWVPYLVRQVRRDNVRRRKAKDPVEYFKTGRVFVACEGDEDINTVAELIGEESFVVGSDYPHGDPSRQDNMVAEYQGRKDLSPRMLDKMFTDNPKRLYGM